MFFVNKAYYVYITNQTNLRKVVVCVSLLQIIVCFQTKLAPDEPILPKYDHSNLFHSLHVGLIKPSHFTLSIFI